MPHPTRFKDPADPSSTLPPLASETRESVNINCAAYHLSGLPQTLRQWASADSGPLRPRRPHGHLHWGVSDLRELTSCKGAAVNARGRASDVQAGPATSTISRG